MAWTGPNTLAERLYILRIIINRGLPERFCYGVTLALGVIYPLVQHQRMGQLMPDQGDRPRRVRLKDPGRKNHPQRTPRNPVGIGMVAGLGKFRWFPDFQTYLADARLDLPSVFPE